MQPLNPFKPEAPPCIASYVKCPPDILIRGPLSVCLFVSLFLGREYLQSQSSNTSDERANTLSTCYGN